jgi:uncharacterized protein YfkK (UPF0435 family)
MTNVDSKTEIIDAILKNREIIKNRIHLKQFKEHLTKEEIKKLQKPITDKLDNITEFASLMMNEANPKNVLAIEEEDRQQGLPRVHQRGFKDPGLDEDWQAQSRGKAEDKNVSKNAEGDDVSESDHLLRLPKSPSASTSISLDPNKDLNFDIIEKQFKFEKPSHLLWLDIRNRNAKIDTTIPEISTKLKSLNAHITNAKKSQEQEKIDNLQYVYSQLKKYKSVLEDIRKIPFYEKVSGIFSDPNEMVERLNLLIASKNAGNDSINVYNECVEILDQLLNLKLIKKSDHKRIFSTQLAFLN